MEILLLFIFVVFFMPVFRGKQTPGKRIGKFVALGGTMLLAITIFVTCFDTAFPIAIIVPPLILIFGYSNISKW